MGKRGLEGTDWIMAKGSSRLSAMEVTLGVVSDGMEGGGGVEIPFYAPVIWADDYCVFDGAVLLYPS